jgi:hypothetical protein
LIFLIFSKKKNFFSLIFLYICNDIKNSSKMKKLLLLLIMALFAMTSGISQTIEEGFEGTFPPSDWSSNGDWVKSSSRAHTGSSCAYVSDGLPGGRLILPAYEPTEFSVLSFYLSCSYYSYSIATSLTVEVATTLENPQWTVVEQISYPENNSVWDLHEITFEEYVGQTIYVCLNVVNNNGSGTYIDDVRLRDITCPQPTLSYVSSTSSTATFAVTSVSNANGYNLEIVENDLGWEESEIITSTDTIIEVTDLQLATVYKARLVANCGEGDVSDYTNVVTFNTSCADYLEELPYNEPFDNLNCWAIPLSVEYYGNNYPAIYLAEEGNRMQTAGGDVIMALASIIAFDHTQAEIILPTKAYFSYNSPQVDVGYMTNLQDTSSFVAMTTLSSITIDYQEFVVSMSNWDLEDGTDYYLAIRIRPDVYYDAVYMDNLQIRIAPDCPSPVRTSVTVSANSDNATVSWIDSNEEHNAWIVYYKEENATEWQTQDATEQSVVLTNLEAETTYQVYVVTNCGIDGEVEQTYTVEFTTTPAPIEIPYFQDFEDEESVSGFLYYTNTQNAWAIGEATGYVETNEEGATAHSLYISNDGGITNAYTHTSTHALAAFLAYLEPGSEYKIEFDYKVAGEPGYDYLQLYVRDPLVSLADYWSGEAISEKLSAATSWTHYETIIPIDYAGTTKQIAFYWRNDGTGGNQPPIAIDNISITPVSCVRPTEIAVVDVASTQTTITWQSDADSYIITIYPSSNQNDATQYTTDENTFTFTDLDIATNYSFSIQSVCGEEVSQPSSVINFTTSCDAIVGPVWFEDFESVLGNQEAAVLKFSCWSVLNSTSGAYNGTFPRIYHEGHAPSSHSGMVTLEFKGDGLLLLPEFISPTNTLQLSFYANTTASTIANAGLFEVGYVSNPLDTATFVSLATVTPVGLERSSSELVGPFLFTDALPDSRIALRYTAVDALESWNLDDFKVEPIPECPSPIPSSVVVSNVTQESATISWVDNDETHTQWLVYYKAEGDEEYSVVVATEQNITLNGLEMITQYTVYVQTDCGIEENYSQTNPVTFRTTTEAINDFPYSQDFQNLESDPFNAEIIGTGANQWIVGSAVGFASEEGEELSSLYISNNSSSFAYSPHEASDAYAVLPIEFGDALEYQISFDYKVGGEQSSYATYDYLSVILCDAGVEFTSGQPVGEVLLNKAALTDWTRFNYSSASLSNTTKQLVFYWRNDGASGMGIPAAIDNISITPSDCPSPTGLTATNVGAEEVTLSWDESETSTIWNLYYKAEGESEYITLQISENPYTLTELMPSTNYTAYITTMCSGEESGASNQVSFRTTCSVIDIFPYHQGFDEMPISFEQECWESQAINGSYNFVISTSDIQGNYPFGQGMAKINYFVGETRLNTPVFDITSLDNPYVKFSFVNPSYSGNQETLTLQYRTNGGEWQNLMTINNGNETWITDSIALPEASEQYQISFKITGNNGWGVGIDEVFVYNGDEGSDNPNPDPEPCYPPTGISASNITQTSADITWNATASLYEIRIDAGTIETITTNSYTFTNLNPNTFHAVEVRAVCEEEVSTWVSTTFTTLEEVVTPEPCDAPTNLAASNITETSAEITWNGTASTYEIKVNGGKAETLTTTTKTLTN